MEEKQNLHVRLLDAVKDCQRNLGGKHELVTGSSSYVSCLCAQLEAVLQHKLKTSKKSLEIIKQVALSGSYEEITFWNFIKNHLSKDEIERFENLTNIRSDIGRGRAWLRCSLNEHSLERYFYIFLSDPDILRQYYEEEALLLDDEISSTLPSMAAGLASIYFSINFDVASLDGSAIKPTLHSLVPTLMMSQSVVDEVTDDIIEASFPESVKKRGGRKKKLNVISFGDADDDVTDDVIDDVTPAHKGGPGFVVKQTSVECKYDVYGGEVRSMQRNLEDKLCLGQQENGMTKQKIDVKTMEQTCGVTQHLETVRHNSSAGGHDLVMDDWSVRSSSVSGAFAVGDSSLEFYPVPNDESAIKSSIVGSSSLHMEEIVSPTRESATPSVGTHTSSGTHASESELRQTLIVTLQAKDEILEKNRSMRKLLEAEMLQTSSLRKENGKLLEEVARGKMAQVEAGRENEVLRSQLKKYVSAVQTMSVEDVSGGEEVYERKLVEMAGMHAELVEFNEHIHTRLKSAINLLRYMRSELVDLRGPMPTDDLVGRIEADDIIGILESSSSPARISVWMPSVLLKGRGPDASHFYQVFIRAGDDEWNVYRRYSEFHEFHLQIAKKFPVVETFNFPPKKLVGNKSRQFVEERRRSLQSYIRLMINNIIRNHEKIISNPTKTTLVTLLPFFSETLSTHDDSGNTKKKGKLFR
uniref:sorting nexin-29 n=1 Tax=Ciona intestinalis TaxID=7719 RepID=UPI000180B51F|nr:sorting nexin-29 [Ciona intestinalis]|eukprot:XP_002130434.1 sorting nexin-29 [Ciona intestinalis]